MNHGCHRGELGRVKKDGMEWTVDRYLGTRVDGYSDHDHQKRDLQVSKKGGLIRAKGNGVN